MLELRVVSALLVPLPILLDANDYFDRCYNWSDVDLSIGRDLRKNQGRSVAFPLPPLILH